MLAKGCSGAGRRMEGWLTWCWYMG
jgi:hypothetical protein